MNLTSELHLLFYLITLSTFFPAVVLIIAILQTTSSLSIGTGWYSYYYALFTGEKNEGTQSLINLPKGIKLVRAGFNLSHLPLQSVLITLRFTASSNYCHLRGLGSRCCYGFIIGAVQLEFMEK